MDVITQNLRDYGWEVLPHASYSPDMSSPDFDIFPKLREPMHGQRFSCLEELSTDVTRDIRRMKNLGISGGIIMLPPSKVTPWLRTRLAFGRSRVQISVPTNLTGVFSWFSSIFKVNAGLDFHYHDPFAHYSLNSYIIKLKISELNK